MKKSILNLEGVQVLTKKQMKMVDGGRRCSLDTSTEPQVLYSPGTTEGPNAGELVPVAVTCAYTCRNTFLGIGVGSTYTVWGGC
ncbi:hypothetical protein FIA58_013405 [Flavobacterium jejuense]|uniref:Uncharacterized protein n=1 Tax=Flavobacterium jejuense TaxID=1544455 RepID=A0ABX0IT00_9FLAO|nr:hypothetical protein [Flavobacterium jejuense]NHN26676.1 hypothetical protein [Flavobacterium jejuense]